MTRKHYDMLAALILKHTKGKERAAFTSELSIELFKDNPNFDRTRFERACGVK